MASLTLTDVFMKQLFFSVIVAFLATGSFFAQSGCPGCAVNLPAGLPDDTLYLPPLPAGEKGKPYDADLSFRVPKTTTPVSKVDTTTPPGLPISRIEIVGVENLPPGLSWQANKTVFETASETDGCFKMCGIPLKADSFVLTVKLRATVFIFTQETSFTMSLVIKAPVSTNQGFTMTNVEGCGTTTVTFTNNIPSNGKSGFSYEWDLGDGTKYTGETPPPHTYTQPGTYVVNYKARIDTVGYILTGITIVSLGCTDLFSNPDPYLRIAKGGQPVFQNNHVNDISLPYTFNMNLPLTQQTNYTLEVWDEDSGIDLSDDLCGSLPFNVLSGGDTLQAGGLRVILQIVNPIEEITASDTVVVYPLPAPPTVTASQTVACAGEEIVLVSSQTKGTQQWFRNGQPIAGATDFIYLATESGSYQVQFTDSLGCSAISLQKTLLFYPLPNEPVFLNDRNNLELIDTTALPANYALQWYMQGVPIPGANGFEYCAQRDGTYALEVTDLSSGCTRRFTMTVTVNPNFDCMVSTHEQTIGRLTLYPNPTSDAAWLELEEVLDTEAHLRIWDASGRLLHHRLLSAGHVRIQIDGAWVGAGVYIVELQAGTKLYRNRWLVVR